jgi:putative peptide zinc metalloprotease protein
MNLAEALDVALPELPVRRREERRPRLDPNLVVREEVDENGRSVYTVHVPGSNAVLGFSAEQWALVQYFDGQRSYADVCEAIAADTGAQLTENDVREFSAVLEESGFWYRTPQERNIAVSEKLAEERRHRTQRKFSFGDLSRIHFSAWDPDVFLTSAHERLRFLFSRWFTALTLALFAFTAWLFIDRWKEIGQDTLQYYNFADKGLADLAEFWVLFFVLGFFHESAHGLTCKHFGGHVHSMGFQLLYLAPTFFVDVVEAWVYAVRRERLAIIIAGVWVELIFCSMASIVWWATPPGASPHEIAYKVMLITGVAVVIVNMNPLIKLDGYFFFTEVMGIADIKEKSTAYLTSWIKNRVFRLPVEVSYVPRRRQLLFVVYALASGAYSYLLLFFVWRFAYNVMHRYSPEWAFVPALALGYAIFKSRIRMFGGFMKTVYLDKWERLRAWFTITRLTLVGAALLLLMLIPIWPDEVKGEFLLEPAQRAVVRNAVPGTVIATFAEEGQAVGAGMRLAQLRNLKLESQAAQARVELAVASSRLRTAELQYYELASADRERRRLATISQELEEQVSRLQLVSPISGVVVTPRVRDLQARYLEAGTEVAEVADTSNLRARIYIPEFSMREVQLNSAVTLHGNGLFGTRRAALSYIAPVSSDLPAGLTRPQAYKGIAAPPLYVAVAILSNSEGQLKDGMTGIARIRTGTHSILFFAARTARDLFARRLW